MQQSAKNYKRIVIKVGSSLFYSAKNALDLDILGEIAREISILVEAGKDAVVVSSGAIALGMHELGLKNRPRDLAHLSAAAAIGQNALMNAYRKFFAKAHSAQVLLTWDDFSERKRYLNAKNTLLTLFKLRSIPVINENDTVSTDEIKFGDNDRLSAMVAGLIRADLLVILSDVDGLLDKNKNVIRVVEEITSGIKELACPTNRKSCVGGMITKLEAAKICVDAGIPCVIASGRKKGIISAVIKEAERAGTLFVPKVGLTAKKHWMAFVTKPKGKIIVDTGAKCALMNKKSLLSVGVLACSGDFSVGDIVSIQDKENCEFARGKVRITAKELDKTKGRRSDKEVIHCDDIVIFREA